MDWLLPMSQGNIYQTAYSNSEGSHKLFISVVSPEPSLLTHMNSRPEGNIPPNSQIPDSAVWMKFFA